MKALVRTAVSMAALLCCHLMAAETYSLCGQDWYIRSSKEVTSDGEALSRSGSFDGWVKVSVPTTVMGGLCEAGVLKDVFFDDNLAKVDASMFEDAWWFRTSFSVDKFDSALEAASLVFEGINYRADAWLNGVRIMSSDKNYGAYRVFQCDVTDIIAENNHLAVRITPPEVGDFYMGFVDWAPNPPDHNMGIFRPVLLKRTLKLSIDNPYVTTDLDTDGFKSAQVEVAADITNHSSVKESAVLKVKFDGKRIREKIVLEPGETRTVTLSGRRLRVRRPRVWWPSGLGSPEMYSLDMEVRSSGKVSDRTSVNFGIRKVESYMDDRGVRGYKINGRPTLIKGAGFCDDMFLRNDRKRYEDEIRYVKEMGLNCLRLEGLWGTGQDLYDLCDSNGILLMTGWSCQWEWPDYLGFDMTVKEVDQNIAIDEGIGKYGVRLSERQEQDLADYFDCQVRWLRNHPSIFVWVVGSDGMPKASLEAKYAETLRKYDQGRSLLISAGSFESSLSGSSGVKMNGPYDYVPPVYWYEDKTLGGAFGFNTEVGPGPQVPLRKSLEKMIPESKLWPYGNSSWIFHSGQKNFASLDNYLDAIKNRYGESSSLDDFEMKAQWINYEAVKAMFEAHVVNRPQATGVIQWQLNSPWPELYWQLYDWYLMPTGAYFGTRKGCQTHNLIYNYFDRKIYACNDGRDDLTGCDVTARLYDSNSRLIFSFEDKTDLAANTSKALAEIPKLENPSGTYFLKTEIRKPDGGLVSDNFYWLSGQEDVVDWDSYFWYYSPTVKYADFKGLADLLKTDIEMSVIEAASGKVKLLFKNKTDKIAFCLQCVISNPQGEYLTPVFWSDNYFSLLGGESKEVEVEFTDNGVDWLITVEGVNIDKQQVSGTSPKVTKEFVYTTADFPQCHASTILEYPKGVLSVAFFGGTRESADDVCIYMSGKKMEDTEWSFPVKVAEDSLHACWNPVLFSPDKDRMMLFYKTGPHVPEWVGHVKTSYDKGQTWTDEYIYPEGLLGAIKDKPVMLPSGRIICPSSEEKRVPGEENKWTVHFEISDDGARTWKKVGPVEADDSVGVIQPSIIIHKDGTLEALCRSSNGKVAVTFSKDDGETWSKIQLTDFPNNNSGLDAVTLPDGRFAMVCNPVGDNWGARYPLCVYLSDDGLNWKEYVNLDWEPVRSGYCYPSMIVGSDGALHIAYTWDRKRIRYARVEI